ncbi:SPFH domain-containing protein [Streptomyces sp. NBC_01022]|uniref:SPFH domain-containing protein n=1 Tax=Streptomyces sp. NBC_01022 TaxID=2903723 RepID=UPI002DDA3AE8|nr:SPFH domain-containing protein [Streptomyces sp. NBC_01022]WRZ81923.1 SPFH domain-containing protein [Streptomyces sp. NBC_01022]
MRSTVSDSSGNPENREDPEYGEERYGAVPVREWVGPDGAGRVTDAWAAAGERAAAREVPEVSAASEVSELSELSAGFGGAAGSDGASGSEGSDGFGWSARSRVADGSASSASDVSDASLAGAVAPDGSDGSARSDAQYPAGPSAVPASGPDSVVDLVLDLVPGEDERAGSSFGATSASVSVPAADPAPVPKAVPAADAADRAPVPKAVPAADAAESAPVPKAADLLPAPAPESGVSAGGDPADGETASAAETCVLVMAGAGSATYGPGAAAPEARDAAAPAPGRGDAPHAAAAPELAPVPELAPASLSLMLTGEDTGEFRTDARVDTGRHQAVIANERTASIPVHLLFREEAEAGADATAVPATVVRKAPGGEQSAGVRRPPVPRNPQVRPSTRPAPVADPRLHERPGPALPGWVAVLTAVGGIAAIGGVLWWAGALPARVLSRIGVGPRPYDGLANSAWAALAVLVTVVLFALGGLSRGRVGYTWVLTLFGRYRGTVRRTGLMWVSPLLLRRRVDVRLRHWRSEPLPAMDANGTALRVVVLVVWRVEDTVRATLGVEDHEEYLREQVEAAMARVLSQLPADAFHEDAHTLRNAEAVGDALTRMLKADCEPVGIEVYSAQPTGIEYAPEVAAAMQRRRIAAIDAKHRDSVLTSVVDAVDDTVNRLTARGLVELDDYERKSLVKDLTVAFYTGRSGGDSA